MAEAHLDRVLDRAAIALAVLGVLGAVVAFCVGAPKACTAALVVAALVGGALYFGPFEWLSITRYRHR